MPRETPIIYSFQDTGYLSVIYLDTDAASFWSVIRRHSLNNLEASYGFGGTYRAMGHDASQVNEVIPSLNESGTYVWLEEFHESKTLKPTSDYWKGARIAWEMIGPNRLRVVITSGDLMPNLIMAWNILTTIWRIYPESREQLPDIDGLVESWAYDEATREKWRERVANRKKDIAASLAALKITVIANEDNGVSIDNTVGQNEWWKTVGRPRDYWNKRAIDRLLTNEDKDTVRAEWCIDYETGNGTHPRATDDGEEKTWHRRVWQPYLKALGAKRAK